MSGLAEPAVQELLHPLPDAVAPGPDDHAAAHAGLLGEVGLIHHGLVPGGKVTRAGDRKSVLHDGSYSRSALSYVTAARDETRSGCAIGSPLMKSSSVSRACMASR